MGFELTRLIEFAYKQTLPFFSPQTPSDARQSAMTVSTRTWNRCSILIACVVVGVVSGCNLLFPEAQQSTTVKSSLKPVVSSREAIALEVYFVDRRIGDPLIGNSLWESLNTVSSIDAATRDQLERDGFRVGMSASRPPRPLQVLKASSDGNDPTRRAEVKSYMVFSDHQTLISCRPIDGAAQIHRQPPEGDPQSIEIKQGEAIFKIQVSRVEDGWAKLVVIPEIQHGNNSLKPTATNTEWTLSDRREAMTLFEDRFSAELNIGEILIIGMTDHGQGRMASHFFHSDKANGLQRLMMIRIADIRKVEPQRQDMKSL